MVVHKLKKFSIKLVESEPEDVLEVIGHSYAVLSGVIEFLYYPLMGDTGPMSNAQTSHIIPINRIKLIVVTDYPSPGDIPPKRRGNKMKIAIEDVLIKTASIEVKVLTLTRKQVTMGVFRQLDMKHCIDLRNGIFVGQIWGRINYHHKCIEDNTHMHVVWQLDNELYHDVIYQDLRCERAYLLNRREYHLPFESEEDEIEWDALYFDIERDIDHLFIAV